MSAVALAYPHQPKREQKAASAVQPSETQEAPTGAAARVWQLLDRVDYRLADSDEERAAVGRLRYQAYLREGAINPDPTQSFMDSHDDDSNAWTFAVYLDDELAASIRLHIATKDCPVLPSREVFPDLIDPKLEAGKTIVDATRLVTDHRLARIHPSLHYVAVRLCWMASVHFKANDTLSAVRPEHQAFYRRTFNQHPICGPRPYPLLNKPISLMTADYREVSDYVYRRYPFFQSTQFERRALFGRTARVAPAVVPLIPCCAEQPPLPTPGGRVLALPENLLAIGGRAA
jgi:N-acyl amino acid synthase FeeM